ncbi:MAG: flagellar basal body P-ring protein FlgI [bacterium]
MKKLFVVFIIHILVLFPAMKSTAQEDQFTVPLKDITRVDGVRENQLRGFGVVTGLDGTGDGRLDFVNRSIANALQGIGINVEDPSGARLDNIAAVMVTATLPPFKKSGDKIDVTISSLGNAEDLSGGVLLQTPLLGADDNAYAVAQGAVSTGGGGEDNHLTTVRIPKGALVEKEVPFQFVDDENEINFQLRRGDFTTASRIADAINENFGVKIARAENSNTIQTKLPPKYQEQPAQFISIVENLEVDPGRKNKVIINERTGTVVMGGEISVRPTAISHGDISLQVTSDEEEATAAEGGETMMLPESTSVQEVVEALNAVGASTDTVIAVLTALDRSNALSVPLEVM